MRARKRATQWDKLSYNTLTQTEECAALCVAALQSQAFVGEKQAVIHLSVTH